MALTPEDEDDPLIAMEGHAAATLAVDATPDAMSTALALARKLLPTAPLLIVEKNLHVLHVLEVHRSQVDDVENMEIVDWGSIQIVETHDDEGRIAIMSENQICELVGLTEDTTNVPAQGFECQMDKQGYANELGQDNDGVVIPTSDAIPGHRQASAKCPLNGIAKKRKRTQPRKNVTKATPAEPRTPRRPTREEILWDSPGRVTRSKLAMLLGDGTSSQTDNTSPMRMPIAAAPKKMTPKRKLHIG
ncbi:hypothetical protein GUJ93_ZPchr0013g34419 [Zizania palustris]|uniref:Uncharacterized protein n=1 Tax=Zizania palustris TaxID=103762 RepID=A0A8J6C3R3_ZIZPA|nr:hypothetical protein GUJ93_ZPchr0013g34419 [Zizania palustris]